MWKFFTEQWSFVTCSGLHGRNCHELLLCNVQVVKNQAKLRAAIEAAKEARSHTPQRSGKQTPIKPPDRG
jgi:hypothetical protein